MCAGDAIDGTLQLKPWCAKKQMVSVGLLHVSIIIKELWENLPLNEGYKTAGSFTKPGLNVSEV